MTVFIILTPAQADSVRGTDRVGAALDPRKTILGDFALPLEVLDDPMHASRRAFLAARPRRTVTELEWFLTGALG